MSDAATLALVGVPLAGLVGLGGSMVAADRRSRKLLVQRIGAIRPGVAPPPRAIRKRSVSLTDLLAPFLDPLLGIDRKVASDETMPVAPWLVLGAIAGLAVTIVLTKLFGLPLLLALAAAALAGVAAARMGVAGRRTSVRTRMEDEFSLALGVIIRCVRAGLPVTEGMRAVSAEVAAPTGPEFRRCVDQIQLGEDFDEAIVKLADRCAIPDYRFFATSVSLQRQTGGNLSETLDNLSETVRRRKAVRLKAQALTSETRATVAVLAILPAAVAVLLLFVNPDYIMQLFTTSGGKSLLGAAIGIQAFGLLVIRAIIRQSLG